MDRVHGSAQGEAAKVAPHNTMLHDKRDSTISHHTSVYQIKNNSQGQLDSGTSLSGLQSSNLRSQAKASSNMETISRNPGHIASSSVATSDFHQNKRRSKSMIQKQSHN